MSLETARPRVKEEREGMHTHHVSIKTEAESNEEAEGLKSEYQHVTQDTVSIKQELSWEDGAGLYANYEVKEELVLGPESLQRSGRSALMICGATGRTLTAAHETAKTTSAEQDTDAAHKVNTIRNIVEINTYMCDICGNLFLHKNKLIRHIKMHLRENQNERSNNGEKALFCKICNKQFRQSGHLYRHERTHSGAQRHSYSCQVCSKQFRRLDTLKLHTIIHTGRKPYSCEMCDKQFTQLCNLTRHTRIHTGEKPYPCEICLKRFTQSCDLKKHIRIHTGDKPYFCEICSKRFTCSGDLRTHKRSAIHKREVRTATRRKK